MPDVAYTGNLTSDPVLRYTNSGKAWVSGTIIENKKDRYDKATNSYVKSEDKLVLHFNMYGALAENFAASARKGQRWVLTGDLVTREFEQNGVRRSVTEVLVHDAGMSVLYGRTQAAVGPR